MNLKEEIDRMKKELAEIYNEKCNLCDPKIIEYSERLDQLIVAYQRSLLDPMAIYNNESPLNQDRTK